MSAMDKNIEESGNKNELNVVIEEISGEEHLAQVKRIAKKLCPLVLLVRGFTILGLLLFVIITITQIVQWILGYPLSSFMLSITPWLSEHNYVVVLFSFSVAVTLWFGCQFFKQFDYLMQRVSQGAVFVSENSKATFNMAKFYLLAIVCFFPASIGISYENSSNCQDASFTSEIVSRLYELVFTDLLFVGVLFIIAHIVTLAIRLDHEQKLTV